MMARVVSTSGSLFLSWLVRVWLCVYVYIYVCVCMCVYVCVCMRIGRVTARVVYQDLSSCAGTCVGMYVYVCMCVYVYVDCEEDGSCGIHQWISLPVMAGMCARVYV